MILSFTFPINLKIIIHHIIKQRLFQLRRAAFQLLTVLFSTQNESFLQFGVWGSLFVLHIKQYHAEGCRTYALPRRVFSAGCDSQYIRLAERWSGKVRNIGTGGESTYEKEKEWKSVTENDGGAAFRGTGRRNGIAGGSA